LNEEVTLKSVTELNEGQESADMNGDGTIEFADFVRAEGF
jgi:hypothetical protein